MYRTLVVGDVHATPDELDDCKALLGLIHRVVDEADVREILFLGDQYHTHSVVRLEVMSWWTSVFRSLSDVGVSTTCLVGNHDQAFPGSSLSSMEIHLSQAGVNVVSAPFERDGVVLIPYMSEQEKFVKVCVDHYAMGAKTVFCHQTFSGSVYENGMYAGKEAFDPLLIPQENIISGHIHTPQSFGKVWYPGAPRWRTLNDANTDRNIWLLEIEKGKILTRQAFDTGNVCRRIRHLVDTEKSPVPLPLIEKDSYCIDIKGDPAWCRTRRGELEQLGVRLRTFPDRTNTGTVKESDGIKEAFGKFLRSYCPERATPRQVLQDMANERIHD